MIKSKPLISKMWRPSPDSSERSQIFRFDRNERTTVFSDEELNNLYSSITAYDLVAYGELEPFYRKVSSFFGIERDNILLTSGSDAAIKSVFETYVSHGDEVIITLPNYAMFSVYASMFGAKETKFFHNEDLHLNIELLMDQIKSDIRMLVISNPSHTGKVIPEDKLQRLIEKAEKNSVIILLDEAYYHFYNKSMVNSINDFNNLIITRTFSKAIGLASLRIGALIANKSLINELYKVKLVHEITGFAAKVGEYIIDNRKIINTYVDQVNLGKEILQHRLAPYLSVFYKSESNFIFFKFKKEINTKKIIVFLEKNNIYIKGPFDKFPFNHHFRVTVGSEKQMILFCDFIDKFIKQQ